MAIASTCPPFALVRPPSLWHSVSARAFVLTQWDQFRLLRDTMPSTLPIILNGDVFSPDDVPRAFEATAADSLMLARGALWTPSIFRLGRSEAMETQAACVARFFELGEQTGCPVGNLKYASLT